jgi:hypothetical protein
MGQVNEHNVEEVFTYRPPTEEKIAQYTEIRQGVKAFVDLLLKNCPQCADRTSAIRHVRNAVMEANAAIALDGKI